MFEDYLVESDDTLTLPYSFITTPWTHNPAVSTENAIFYAVNPYWQVFEGLIRYCNNQSNTQLVVTSSWSPITIWRYVLFLARS